MLAIAGRKRAARTTNNKTFHPFSLQRWRLYYFGVVILLVTVYQFTSLLPKSHVAVDYVSPPSSYAIVSSLFRQEQTVLAPLLTRVPRYAYAFIISGCNPRRAGYRDYIYNILVAARNLRGFGSKADFVVFLQMSWKTNETALPFKDERLLKAMNITIKYLPKHEQESFYRTMMDKFRVLGLTEYDRVLLLDGDVMPMGNLDYLFHLSQQGILRQNLIVQGEVSPANGGFFMLKPGGIAEINEIIQRRQREAVEMGPPYFNETLGWGHIFHEPDDVWASLRKRVGADWTFYGAFADQGLLYYWVKYVQKDVSICHHNGTVQNWYTDSEGELVVQTLEKPFVDYSNVLKCWGDYCMSSPMQDYIHFTGRNKSWLQGPPENLSRQTQLDSAVHFWFWQLKEINEELKIGLSLPNRWTKREPSLGLTPDTRHIVHASVDLLT